jgi:hypothetical protein
VASAQTYNPDDHSPEYQADYLAAHEKCMAPHEAEYEERKAADTACREAGKGLCMGLTGWSQTYRYYKAICTQSAIASADRAERARGLASSVGVTGPALPKAAGPTQVVTLPGMDKPAIKAPVALPESFKTKTGLTLTVPVNITNFHTSWNGQSLAAADTSLLLVCRVFPMPENLQTMKYGVTRLPPIQEGGSLDMDVEVNVKDINVTGLYRQDDSFDSFAECGLMQPGAEADLKQVKRLDDSPKFGCGDWTDNKDSCKTQ